MGPRGETGPPGFGDKGMKMIMSPMLNHGNLFVVLPLIMKPGLTGTQGEPGRPGLVGAPGPVGPKGKVKGHDGVIGQISFNYFIYEETGDFQ